MNYFQMGVRFLNCQKLEGLESVRSLAHNLAAQQFLPAEAENNLSPSLDIDRLVTSRWKPRDLWDESRPFEGSSLYRVPFRLIPVTHPDIISSFSCAFYGLAHSTIGIGGLVDFEFKDQRPELEPYAQSLLKLANTLYPILAPSFGWVDESEATGRYIKEAVKTQLKVIGWANFFGPSFVETYGRDFLLGLPGWKVEELADGGVFHQLSPAITADDPKSALELRRRVEKYCADRGLKVRCRGPYYIPGGQTGESGKEGYGSDEEFKLYLETILGTTLTLDDGTRVKPIYIQWQALTLTQRELALGCIRAAAISEVREHRDVPIRFEFNELPDDLAQAMRDVVGEDNPDFVFVQTNMDADH